MHSDKRLSTYILFAAIGVVIGAGFIAYPKAINYFERIKIDKENQDVMLDIINSGIINRTVENIKNIPSDKNDVPKNDVNEPEVILENAYLDVPFVCQAPLQTEENWKYHEESCEEAALLQVHYYIENKKTIDPQEAHEIILDMINWQENNFGEHRDLYANDMKIFIRDYYGYEEDEIQIIYNADILDIKKAVSAGYPVIVPIMGNVLQNPYYPEPGYHMLTVIGYTPEHVITNDVGTKRGKDFSYTYDMFTKATKAAGGDIIVIRKLPPKPELEAETGETSSIEENDSKTIDAETTKIME